MNCEGFTVSGSLIAGEKTLSNQAELEAFKICKPSSQWHVVHVLRDEDFRGRHGSQGSSTTRSSTDGRQVDEGGKSTNEEDV